MNAFTGEKIASLTILGVVEVDAIELDHPGPATHLGVDRGDVLADQPGEEELYAGEEEQRDDQRGQPGRRVREQQVDDQLDESRAR